MSQTVFAILTYTMYGHEYGAVACRFMWETGEQLAWNTLV